MKKWNVKQQVDASEADIDYIISTLLKDRGINSKKDIAAFFHPKHPAELTCRDVGIDAKALNIIADRLQKAIQKKESIVVYADYDADGITAGAILWETLYKLGASVMPYIPHRQDEGYGFSIKGLDTIKQDYNPTLVISVDHGITAHDPIEYARQLGMEVIVTDHHLKPEKVPNCHTLHTTQLSGAGVAFFLAKELLRHPLLSLLSDSQTDVLIEDTLCFAAIGTIADMVPLKGSNRSIAKYGLEAMQKTKRVGLLALMREAGVVQEAVTPYSVSHMIAPRLNAMGRLTHALDALRLLCTRSEGRASKLAQTLGMTNKERQQITLDTVIHAKQTVANVYGSSLQKKILIVSHESYNQGIIGLVAGKLVEEHYRPAIVLAKGEYISKASARSIPGFNIVEAIRNFQDLLVDVGGHPFAAGFTIETEKISLFKEKLEEFAERLITEEMMIRSFVVDMEVPIASVTETLWQKLEEFAPYGLGNYEPVFVTRRVHVADVRKIGAEGKHIKLRIRGQQNGNSIDAIAFNQADKYPLLVSDTPIDIAYTISMNEWNGKKALQLIVKDLNYFSGSHTPSSR